MRTHPILVSVFLVLAVSIVCQGKKGGGGWKGKGRGKAEGEPKKKPEGSGKPEPEMFVAMIFYSLMEIAGAIKELSGAVRGSDTGPRPTEMEMVWSNRYNKLWDDRCETTEITDPNTLLDCKDKCMNEARCNAIGYCAQNCTHQQCYLYACNEMVAPEPDFKGYPGYGGYILLPKGYKRPTQSPGGNGPDGKYGGNGPDGKYVETTAAPADETTAAPADETTAAPADETTAAPAGETTAAHADETTTAPAYENTAASAVKTTATPADETTTAPAVKTTAAPADETTAAPTGEVSFDFSDETINEMISALNEGTYKVVEASEERDGSGILRRQRA